MYLLPAAPSKTKGMSFIASMGAHPRRGRGMGWPVAPRRRSLGRLGQDGDETYDDFSNTLIDPTATATPPLILIPSSAGDTTNEDFSNVLTAPTATPANPVTLSNMPLPTATVQNLQAQNLAQYSTQAAALAAGVAPSVVSSLWGQSRTVTPAATSSLFSGNTLLYVAGGLLVFALVIGMRK
jgi:hypothetical protein